MLPIERERINVGAHLGATKGPCPTHWQDVTDSAVLGTGTTIPLHAGAVEPPGTTRAMTNDISGV